MRCDRDGQVLHMPNARFQPPLEAVGCKPLLGRLRYLYPVALAGLPASWTSRTPSIGLRSIQIGEAIHLCELATR
jgi:hypothetical protein